MLKATLGRLRASILIAAPEPAKRLDAARALAPSGEGAVKSLLQERLAAETDAEVRGVLMTSIAAIESKLAWGERLGVVFTGISLGSILLLVALGLAITYGLMGVINMAHGELMMIGAYATYVVQNLFRQHAPGAFDYYIWLAIPASFAAAAAGGRGPRTHGTALALRPAAGDPAGHLGHLAGPDAVGAQPVRCAERAGREPGLAVRAAWRCCPT